MHTLMEIAPIAGEQGEVEGAVAGVMDITNRRLMEQDLAWQAEATHFRRDRFHGEGGQPCQKALR